MKRSAVLINVSRAEIADEAALYEALEQGAIAGAFLDVWYAYPAGGDETVQPSRFPFHGSGIRPASLRRFPFSIYFEVVDDIRYIWAVFHHRRDRTAVERRRTP